MRWVFLSLVCLNLLVMVWFWRDQAGASQHSVIEPEQMGETLVLLSELDSSDLKYKQAKSGNAAEGSNRCYSVGPLADRIDAKHLKVRAEALGFNSELRGLATGTSIEHWVHIPPQANRQQSLRLLRELQGRGIDSYIITQGDLAEGISLGLFRSTESANKLSKKMKDLNYDVVIQEVSRGQKELWLEFPQVTQLTEAMRKRVVGEGQKLEWMLTDCSHTK
jgi:cell division septation protein DedD